VQRLRLAVEGPRAFAFLNHFCAHACDPCARMSYEEEDTCMYVHMHTHTHNCVMYSRVCITKHDNTVFLFPTSYHAQANARFRAFRHMRTICTAVQFSLVYTLMDLASAHLPPSSPSISWAIRSKSASCSTSEASSRQVCQCCSMTQQGSSKPSIVVVFRKRDGGKGTAFPACIPRMQRAA
jgi:hypothetical protein